MKRLEIKLGRAKLTQTELGKKAEALALQEKEHEQAVADAAAAKEAEDNARKAKKAADALVKKTKPKKK